MCEQCVAATVTIGEVVPGFYLVRATRAGAVMLPGQYGLVEQNDPFYVFSSAMTAEPGDDYDPDMVSPYWDDLETLSNMTVEPATGYRLVAGALAAGYQMAGTAEGEGFYTWLLRRCAELTRVYASRPQRQ